MANAFNVLENNKNESLQAEIALPNNENTINESVAGINSLSKPITLPQIPSSLPQALSNQKCSVPSPSPLSNSSLYRVLPNEAYVVVKDAVNPGPSSSPTIPLFSANSFTYVSADYRDISFAVKAVLSSLVVHRVPLHTSIPDPVRSEAPVAPTVDGSCLRALEDKRRFLASKRLQQKRASSEKTSDPSMASAISLPTSYNQ